MAKTTTAGEISLLEPADYGAVTIDKSITINGTKGGVVDAITVGAAATDQVVLRDLSINGDGTGDYGIRYLSGKVLLVENCAIAGFSTRGIDVVASTETRLTVINTTFVNVGAVAIRVTHNSGVTPPIAVLDNVRISRASIGFDTLGLTVGTISNSTIFDVTNQAIVAEGSSTINVVASSVTKSGTGVSAFAANSTVRLRNVSLFNNTTGVSVASGATAIAYGSNAILGNGTDVSGNLTYLPAQLDLAGNLNVGGNITAAGDISGAKVFHAVYQDVAEWVPASEKMSPGTVVVLNPERANEVMPSAHPYDTMVAGVVSAQPGVLLGEAGATKEQIATTGRVKVRVDARHLPIRIGDLLVSSDVPGTAMRSEPTEINGRSFHQPGTIIGKALEPLDGGMGEILVLLSLQ